LGTGVSTALIAAAVLAFVSVAAFVAFDGMPFSSADSPESTVSLSGAPQAAALTASSTAQSVAADPETPSATALGEIAAALPSTQAATGSGPGPGGVSGVETGGGSTGPGGGGSGGGGGTGGTTEPGPLQGTVGAVDDTAGGLGLDLSLSETTDGIIKGLDDTVGGTLNNVGNGIGAGNLGDKVNNAVGELLGD
jgi:hypothetical protein